MDGKHKRIKSKYNDKEFLSTAFVEESLGHEISIDRFDVESSEYLSICLQQIMELEETGSIFTVAESEETNSLISLVRKALVRMPKIDREILVRYHTGGETVAELAKRFNLPAQQVVNTRLKATTTFKNLFIEQKQIADITADYNVCPICNSKDKDQVDESIHVWLDDHQWQMRGVLTYLKDEFDIVTNLVTVSEHVEYHMLMPSDATIFHPIKTEKEEFVSITLTIPTSLKTEIESIIQPYDVSYKNALLWCIKFGLLDFEQMLEINEKKRNLQKKAAHFYFKLSI